jgi:hypothetical protein
MRKYAPFLQLITWGKPVYKLYIGRGITSALYSARLLFSQGGVLKSRFFTTTYPGLYHRLSTAFEHRSTVVISRLLPTIHSTYNNNYKNIPTFLLLIEHRLGSTS